MYALEVKKINKKYPKFNLKDVSFSIELGSICGFIGRNGAGKTTTLKGIMNLLKLDSGNVKVLGENFFDNELKNKQKISFSLSEINFFPDAKLKSITDVTKLFYKDWDEEKYLALCKKFNLDQNKKIKELSSGMKVKYNLAIALSHNAKLLILDEPTSGLDPVSRDEILDIFNSLVKTKERSILFSTHITSDLEKCANQIVYIKNGEIIDDKSKRDFIDSYRYVEGPEDLLKEVKNILISHKIDDNKFSGLIDSKNIDKLPENIKCEEPSLDTIMVYIERSDEDEEFIY